MAFSVLFFKNPLLWIAILLPILACTGFLGYGFLPIFFTISVLILSSVFFTFSRHKAILMETPLQEEDELPISPDHGFEPQLKQTSPKPHLEIDPFSESESIGHSSVTEHDSDIDSPCMGNRDCSDGSISDEESLIEIALPSGHFVNSDKLSDFPCYRGMFADMNEVNEEDNLIEIDLSIGSIKCSRFEIKA